MKKVIVKVSVSYEHEVEIEVDDDFDTTDYDDDLLDALDQHDPNWMKKTTNVNKEIWDVEEKGAPTPKLWP